VDGIRDTEGLTDTSAYMDQVPKRTICGANVDRAQANWDRQEAFLTMTAINPRSVFSVEELEGEEVHELR
jgi:hypothetical protein